MRRALLERGNELAEDNVELDFTQLGLLAIADPEAEVREAGAKALWESESREVANALANLVEKDADSDVRAAAAESLSSFVALAVCTAPPPKESDRVIGVLRTRVEDRSEAVPVRAAALDALGPVSEEWLDPLIRDAYESGDRDMRLAAIHAMGGSCEEQWLDYVHEQLYSDDPALRFGAVMAAGEIGSEDSIEPLASMLEDEDPVIVMAAVESLGDIGGDEVVQILEEFAARVPEGEEERLEMALAMAREGGMVGFVLDGDEEE